ncbi:MAG TPA: nuclear transport factor 2 family protein [Pyrinomonadaceae bacterium]|nr:nuclear transport factor 2 family protein [Pyrinomonadaceae bacterium]
MKRLFLIALLALAAAAPCAAQTRRGRARPSTPARSVEQQVKQFEREFVEARRQARRGNPAPLRQMLAPDFVATSLNGRVVNKEQFVRASGNRNLRFTTFQLDEPQVRVYPGSAVVTGRVTVRSRGEESGERTFQFRYTSLYVGGGNSWQVAALHLTPVANQ